MTEPIKPGKRIATYEDVLRAPRDKIDEVLEGDLILNPRPRFEHSMVASCMNGDLSGPFHRKPGGPHGPGGVDPLRTGASFARRHRCARCRRLAPGTDGRGTKRSLHGHRSGLGLRGHFPVDCWP